MIRRDFVTTCIVAPLLGFTEGIGLTKSREYVHSELGKYINHTLKCEIDTDPDNWLGEPSPYCRYVQFPIEANLEIEFKHGCFKYTAFNISADDLIKIRKMNINKLMSYSVPSDNEFHLDAIVIGENKFVMAYIQIWSDNGS